MASMISFKSYLVKLHVTKEHWDYEETWGDKKDIYYLIDSDKEVTKLHKKVLQWINKGYEVGQKSFPIERL